MPNFILTESCNKNCKYCFARGSHELRPEMSVQMAKQLIDRISEDGDHIQLLGGEPTIAKNFKEIFDYLMHKQDKSKECGCNVDIPTLITNNLFSEDICNFLFEYLERGYKFSMLLNATELDEQDRFPIFLRNYNKLAQLNIERMSIGITIDATRSTKYLVNYVKWLIKNVPSPHRYMRLSAPMPSGVKTYIPYEHKVIGRKIYKVCKAMVKLNCSGNFDCALVPCLFTDRQYSFIHKYFTSRIICDKTNGPKDIYPDGHVIRCYPGSAIRTEPSDNIDYIMDSIWKRIEDFSWNYPVHLPDKCESCKYYKIKICDGPCLGCLTVDTSLLDNICEIDNTDGIYKLNFFKKIFAKVFTHRKK